MFVDTAKVTIKAGDGGNGVVSFRHEKFIDRGGPDGGDGGDGGNIIFMASRNENTLANFRYQKELVAESGQAGSKQKKHGKSGKDMIVKVPVGTVVTDEAGQVLADLANDEQQSIIALGGKGGFGNAHFVSSRRQAPRIAEKGEPGEQLTLILELKSIADVGLVGLPNAGKSTLLSVVSNARPEIANYPFTTLKPNLGVVDLNKTTSLLVADIPGLIEGAAEGKGLGDEFLRHVERTAVLLHLVDANSDDVVADWCTIDNELQAYGHGLADKPTLVVLTKTAGLDKKTIAKKQKALAENTGNEVLCISAQEHEGLQPLLKTLASRVTKARQLQQKEAQLQESELPVLRLESDEDSWSVEKTDKGFVVVGPRIERFARRTDFDNPEGVNRLRDIMRKLGIMHELERRKINPGQTITISGHDFTY